MPGLFLARKCCSRGALGETDARTRGGGLSDFQKLQRGKDCSEVNLDLGQIKDSGLMGGDQGVIQLAVLLSSACNTLQCCQSSLFHRKSWFGLPETIRLGFARCVSGESVPGWLR